MAGGVGYTMTAMGQIDDRRRLLDPCPMDLAQSVLDAFLMMPMMRLSSSGLFRSRYLVE